MNILAPKIKKLLYDLPKFLGFNFDENLPQTAEVKAFNKDQNGPSIVLWQTATNKPAQKLFGINPEKEAFQSLHKGIKRHYKLDSKSQVLAQKSVKYDNIRLNYYDKINSVAANLPERHLIYVPNMLKEQVIFLNFLLLITFVLST